MPPSANSIRQRPSSQSVIVPALGAVDRGHSPRAPVAIDRLRGGARSTTTRRPRRAPGSCTAGIAHGDARLDVAPGRERRAPVAQSSSTVTSPAGERRGCAPSIPASTGARAACRTRPSRATARATSRAIARAVVWRSDHAGRVSTTQRHREDEQRRRRARARWRRTRARRLRRVTLTGRAPSTAVPASGERPVGHDAREPAVQHDVGLRAASCRRLSTHVDAHSERIRAAEQVVEHVVRPAARSRPADASIGAPGPRAFVDRGARPTPRA